MGPATPDTVDPAVARRLGARLVARRCEREQRIWNWKTRPRDGVMALERFLPVDTLVLRALQLSGLYGRAHRNFLDVRIVEHPVKLRGLPEAFAGFRLLQITDLHCDLDPVLIDGVIEKMGMTQWDLAVLTGDYHNRIGDPYGVSLELMRKLIPHLGPRPLGILGNHDFLRMVPALEAAGLRILLNENVALTRGDEVLWICGVDDPHSMRTEDLRKAREGVPASGCAILLSHSPETHLAAASLGYALQLSGHTHGGQLCLPGGVSVLHRARIPRPLVAGAWRQGDMAGYTSRGTGACAVAARLNCPAEMTLHILEPE